ncbi:anti-sigma factor [Glutamicibacter sp. MNS18]|uniref:anti-sigma factor n=1 Tax=Glutamicibacter sp. MNS18 TaxID=2989817 RepID=UPI0022358604|nr:anti-sigma factor [Glutamicibacter sp. MNS18]MCW4464376.1 anti-sigma factor [Glutamicibacter sp. MNS18]
MNGSSDQRRNDSHDDDLGLGIVDEVASTSRSTRPAKSRGWIFGVLGLAIVIVLALVIFSLRSSSPTNDTSALDAGDGISNTLTLRSGGIATVTTSESADALAVELAELPALDESEQFVVWAVDSEGNVTVLLTSSGGDETGGVSPAADMESIHISVETDPIPDSPTGQTEASVDLPLDPQAPQEDTPAEDEPADG